jgi:4,5:9,10-diseco-3-hydroxy-5,9,17-trioxoandrosta-1(10),2-diene-4-oate hydrolase
MLTRDDMNWALAMAGDIQIHYGERGTGHPVICLHGTGPGSDAWSNFRRNLGPLSESYHVIAMDLPRFGKSQKVIVDRPRLDFLSGVLADFMDALGLSSAHLIGNSMGAQTAMKLAIDRPAMVNKLVLMAPAAVGYSVFAPMPTEAVRQIAGYYTGTGPSREKMEHLLKTLAYDPAFVTFDMVEDRYNASIDPEVLAVNEGPHWARQSLEGELERCVAPTLLVWGQDDRATTLDIGLLLLRKLPDARLHVFGRCGHWAQAEHHEEFNRLVIEFLR